MLAGNRKLFLSVTALIEAATGLCLFVLPAVLFAILLALDHASDDAIFVGRLAGAALLAIGVASWKARVDGRTPAQLGLLTGILVYSRRRAISSGSWCRQQNPARSEAGGHSSRRADALRVRYQPQDCEGARHRSVVLSPTTRRFID